MITIVLLDQHQANLLNNHYKFEADNLWGKNLYDHLQDIYKNKANYTILFISEHYKTKPMLLNEICKVSFYKDIPDAKFNDVYIVNVFKKGKRIKVFHLLY